MKITAIHIENFKSIRNMDITEMDTTVILVGKNNTGKSGVIDVIRAVKGEYQILPEHFDSLAKNVVVKMTMEITEDDLFKLNEWGLISKLKKFDLWYEDFLETFPTYNEGMLSFTYTVTPEGKERFTDENGQEVHKIREIFPKIYYIDHARNLEKFQSDIMKLSGIQEFEKLNENVCKFDKSRKCNRCFNCIGVINKQKPCEMDMFDIVRLLEYKVYKLNLDEFSKAVNKYLKDNGAYALSVKYDIGFTIDELFKVDTTIMNNERKRVGDLSSLSAGNKSIYFLSLLEAYVDEKAQMPCIIMIEDPEIYLHPQLQKEASEILYRLSQKNQLIFTTYSPNMIFNFSSKQIKQAVLDEDYYTKIVENPDIDVILDDLGYTANDLMNVSFVFIVEGKQDRSRLPMLLEKYYSEIRDDKNKLQRISIITTNSCTNIKTYANLKYINELYLKDAFLMIRDSDGKNPRYLIKQLCGYYNSRSREDEGNLPRVEPRNVLVLKYYSFENYFLDPQIMTRIGVVKSEDEFYNIFYQKYRDYLYRLPSMKRLIRTMNVRINNKEDIKRNIEMIKTYVRGHNLFDIFYGKYKGEEQSIILRRYVDIAPRENFKDILDAIDNFVYFQNRKKENEENGQDEDE